jgi:hypothetical protein
MKPPFIPDVSNSIDHYLSNTKTKYTFKLENTKKKEALSLSSDEDEGNPEDYDQNWADEF